MHLCKPAFLDKISLKVHFICARSEKITLFSRKTIQACSDHLFPRRSSRLLLASRRIFNWLMYIETLLWWARLAVVSKKARVKKMMNVKLERDSCAHIYRMYYRERYNSDNEISISREFTYRTRSSAPSLPSPFLDLDLASSYIVLVGLSACRFNFGVCLVSIQFVLTPSPQPTHYWKYDRIKQAQTDSVSDTIRWFKIYAHIHSPIIKVILIKYLLSSL